MAERDDFHEAVAAGSEARARELRQLLEAALAERPDLTISDLIELDGRQYDVVSDKAGGMALEPAITIFGDELFRRHGLRPLTQEEFDEFFGDLPSDGEG